MATKKETVLYISYDGMTDSLGQSQVLPYIVGLSKHFDFHLISFEKPDRFRKYEDTIKAICKENNIEWHPLSYTKQPPIFSTLYDIWKMFLLSKKLDQKHNFKIIHCRSYISAFVGLNFKRKRKKKFLFDMRGFWADERVDGKIWDLKNPVYKWIYNFFKKKEKQFFQESDAIISLTENGKKEILSWNLENVSEAKIKVIPCCVNLNLFNPENIEEASKSELKKDLGIGENDFILGYVGSIGTWYMLPEMLDYFKVLATKKTNAKFLFVSAEDPELILKPAREKGIDEKQIIVVRCLHQQVPRYISLFNQSIFFILPAYSKKASSPTKQGELMAMGIPVVCNAGVGDTDFIVEKYQSGIVIESFKPELYQNSLQDFAEVEFDTDAIREGANDFFSLKVGVESYLSVYHSLSQ